MVTIFVGGLGLDKAGDELRRLEEDLHRLFEPFGEVLRIRLVTDRDTGRSRGFGFVTMSHREGLAAIDALHGTDFGGRTLNVNEARERQPNPVDRFDR